MMITGLYHMCQIYLDLKEITKYKNKDVIFGKMLSKIFF